MPHDRLLGPYPADGVTFAPIFPATARLAAMQRFASPSREPTGVRMPRRNGKFSCREGEVPVRSGTLLTIRSVAGSQPITSG